MCLPTGKAVTRHAATSLAAGAAAGALVAMAMTFADWWQNPGSVFRGSDGTRWNTVWDTWFSWFGPICLLVAAISFAVSSVLERRRRNR